MASKKIRRITDLGTLLQAIFADLAGSIRTVNAGIDLTPKGAINTATRVNPSNAVLVYNSDAAVHYVAFGALETMSAPTNATNGIPIAAGEKYMLNSGTNTFVRSDSALVFAYLADSE